MSDDLRERLIEEVRIRPNIWNSKLKGFKDVKMKELSWHQIAATLNLSGTTHLKRTYLSFLQYI